MALAAVQTTYNAAVDSLMQALEALIEAIPAGDGNKIFFVPVIAESHIHDAGSRLQPNGMVKESQHIWPVKSTDIRPAGTAQLYKVITPVADEAAIPLKIGNHPLFWKVTNAAGETS